MRKERAAKFTLVFLNHEYSQYSFGLILNSEKQLSNQLEMH